MPADPEGSLLFPIINDASSRVRVQQARNTYIQRLERAERITKIGHWEFHLDENLVHASEGTKAIYGIPGESHTIPEVQRIPLIEYRPMLDQALYDLVHNGIPYDVQFSLRRQDDGSIVTVRSIAEYDPHRRIVFGTILDITEFQESIASLEEQKNIIITIIAVFLLIMAIVVLMLLRLLKIRKLTARRLEKSETDYRRLFSSNPNPMWVFDLKTLSFLEVNRAAEKHYGFSRIEFLSMTLADIRPPEEIPALLKKAAEVREELSESGIMTHRKKDGTVIFVETSSHTMTWKGKNACLVLIMDVTEKKLSDEKLKESRRLLRDILDTIPVRVYWKDLNLTYLGCNRPFALDAGYSSPEEVTGKNDYQMNWGGYADEYRAHDENVISSKLPILHYEEQHTTKDGEKQWVLASKIPLRNAEGAASGILGSYEDITEQKRSEEQRRMLQGQLMQAQKLETIGRIAGGIAHDFNNMLGVILGHTELLMEDLDASNPQYHSIEEINTAAQRSAKLTGQLMAYARKQTISPKILQINEKISAMLTMLKRLIGEDISLLWNPDPDLLPISMDTSQLDQLVINLAVNARDAVTGIGIITLETKNVSFDASCNNENPELIPGTYVMLAVSDSGSGMDETAKQNIFEPFYTTKEIGKGTGLGLSVVYGAVKQNGGFITVYSEPGKGTSIKLYFIPSSGAVLPADEAAAPKPVQGKETILLVEDDKAVQSLCRSILERHGYDVIATRSPKAAVNTVREHPGPIELLVTDVVMPEMNGKELMEQVLDIRPGIRVLFISGYTSNIILHHGIADTGINFLQKPFSMNTFTAAVREILDAPAR